MPFKQDKSEPGRPSNSFSFDFRIISFLLATQKEAQWFSPCPSSAQRRITPCWFHFASLFVTRDGVEPVFFEVELKNGETYNGHLVSCDNWMNIHLREVICTSRVSQPPLIAKEGTGQGV